MPAFLAAILIGVGLAMGGAALAWDEFKVLDARLFLREATSKRITPSLQAIDAAYASLVAGPPWRVDLTAARFELDDLALERPNQGSDIADRRKRARASASATLAGAPLNVRAWCLLAELMVRDRGLTTQAARTLQLCYDVAPRDILVAERRLFLSLINWPLLTPELRHEATRDMNEILSDAEFGFWLAERMAYAAVFLVPEQSLMLESAIKAQGQRLQTSYESALRGYRARIR